MKKIIILMLLASGTVMGHVYFPTGGDGDTYHVDTFGAPKVGKPRPQIPPDWIIETMKPSPKDIVPDGWPTR